uniref:Rhodanese domain-containing protein n=1 Tax=Onchocerca volvulus TaxID=6282 RepID=A0A8R1TUV7_ONCVO
MMAVKEHSLSNDEVMRYSRQILVQEFGVQGQERLRATSLLIVGAGGLGCPVALYCAGAGIGRIGIVDGDFISSDNLHRQIAYDENSVGQSKVESIKSSVKRLNSNVCIDVYKDYLLKRNAVQIVSKYDIIADCTDNVSASCVLFWYLVNDACVLMKKPLVSGSVVRWDGQLSVYGYGEDCPCYRCVFPDPPPVDTVTNCSENGVLGPVVGIIGSMQANEIIKIAAIKKCSFAGFLYLFDALNGKTKTVKLRRQKTNCVVCSKHATITELGDCKEINGCSARTHNNLLTKNDRIDPYSYFKLNENNGKKPLLIDTRPPHEFSIGHLSDAINIPMLRLCRSSSADIMRELGTSINEMRDKGEMEYANGVSAVYVICRRGEDSQIAVLYLRKEFADSLISFKDIDGGYEKWSHAVDKDFPIY